MCQKGDYIALDNPCLRTPDRVRQGPAAEGAQVTSAQSKRRRRRAEGGNHGGTDR
jgi:hypothetical protein